MLREEGVAFEDEALGMIARAADGGLRDALSLTDQVLSLGENGEVTAERVRVALGLIADDEYLTLLDLIFERRAADLFPAVQHLADEGVDFTLVMSGLGELLRAQLAIELGGTPPELAERTRAALVERRGRVSAGDLLRMLHALLEMEPMFRRSGQPQLLLETLLVRFALLDRTIELEEVLKGFGDAPRAIRRRVAWPWTRGWRRRTRCRRCRRRRWRRRFPHHPRLCRRRPDRPRSRWRAPRPQRRWPHRPRRRPPRWNRHHHWRRRPILTRCWSAGVMWPR